MSVFAAKKSLSLGFFLKTPAPEEVFAATGKV